MFIDQGLYVDECASCDMNYFTQLISSDLLRSDGEEVKKDVKVK